jgi:choline monooxygenase
MFTNQTHLRHLLRPDQYTSEVQYRAELRHLFRPAWHPLATVHDLAKSGDFLTFDLLETPILLRNFDGAIRAFLNVCPHRHSKLTDKPRGNAEQLRCQYHGWEFNAEGRTGKIPDAKAFRPWDRENSCLRQFRAETCGDVVYVNLSDDAVSLREWLGSVWEPWSAVGGEYRFVGMWERDFPCNWKVVLENSLESYHIPQVHPKTFKDMSPEEASWHELTDEFTSYRTIPPRDYAARMMDWIVRRLGHPVKGEYWHRVRHPHVTGCSLDVFRLIQAVFPTGPRTCRYRSLFFSLRGSRRGPFAWAVSRMLRAFSWKVARQVFDEDGTIYTGVQQGLESSPHRGVIGTREERIYHFQDYVNRMCQGPRELPLMDMEATPMPPSMSARSNGDDTARRAAETTKWGSGEYSTSSVE